mmetsp:Transcript_38567/g.81119  ORF Transcript_38567/g.81119 Transcript_38567/m.81119 type:complete len:352 (-) Transcript_38567:522-1577(-)
MHSNTSPHPNTSSALTKSTAPSPWTSDILPVVLASHGLQCRDETADSAQHLLSQGQLAPEDFIESSPDIEGTLMEAFLEDDFDGKLHLTTLSTNDEVVGMAFWREVPIEEMTEWMDFNRISKAIADRQNLMASCHSTIDREHCDMSKDAKTSMKLVQTDSIRWIKNALETCETTADDADAASSSPTKNYHGPLLPSKSTMQQLSHAWIKIELIAIKSTHRAHRLGNILLGCTLATAHAFHRNDHAILHIAGGGASKNIPAARLYTRYGFVPVPRHEEGGPFVKPDRDLFVLGNIGRVLHTLPWGEMMPLGYTGAIAGDDEKGGKRQRLLEGGSDGYGKGGKDDEVRTEAKS